MDTARPVTAAYLCDPNGITLPHAMRLARQANVEGLARQVLATILPRSDGIYVSDRATMRSLQVLSAMALPKSALATLLSMVRRCDARVLSKVVLLAGRLGATASWYEDLCRDCTPRIRANAIEGLWGCETEGAGAVFAAAARDPNHRVAMNGLIGMHLAGDAAGMKEIEAAARSAAPQRRAAAAWGLGQIAADAGHPALQQLLTDRDRSVKSAALRAVVKIRKRVSAGE